jgi:pyruvate dehydrogenase E2 component (dihydrolipoyllysine-residue acetyltransferase)
MQIEFRMPSLGADMESATLTEWLKKPGERIHHGEALATVETTKGLIDVESNDDGQVSELIVQPGTDVPVGTVLARLEVEGDARAAAAAPSPPASPPPPAPPVTGPVPSGPAEGQAPESIGERARVSPAARRRAHELGVSIEALERSAAGGVVHVEDIERLAAQKQAHPLDARTAMRTAIGAAMARSKREIPHYYLGHEVDFGPAREWLTRYNSRAPVKDRLIEAVIITKAVALAAARVEGFNGYFRDGRFERVASVHAGAAIAVRAGGLVAPALLDADRKDLPTLMRDFSALVMRARAGHLRSGEFSAATITVTSLGADGADVLYPIINPPQVAIVGAGAIREQPWAQGGQLGVRPILTLALAADHRVSDGRTGSRFLRAIADLLARPEAL